MSSSADSNTNRVGIFSTAPQPLHLVEIEHERITSRRPAPPPPPAGSMSRSLNTASSTPGPLRQITRRLLYNLTLKDSTEMRTRTADATDAASASPPTIPSAAARPPRPRRLRGGFGGRRGASRRVARSSAQPRSRRLRGDPIALQFDRARLVGIGQRAASPFCAAFRERVDGGGRPRSVGERSLVEVGEGAGFRRRRVAAPRLGRHLDDGPRRCRGRRRRDRRRGSPAGGEARAHPRERRPSPRGIRGRSRRPRRRSGARVPLEELLRGSRLGGLRPGAARAEGRAAR